MAARKLVRKIYILGEINEESYEAFSKRLSRLEREGSGPVTIELSSGGGSAYDALAFASRMRSSSVDLHVIAHGLIASAAVIILAYGDKRSMAKEAWVMVHEDSAEPGEMKARQGQDFWAHVVRLEAQWSRLLSERTNVESHVWEQLHDDETYLDAEECLKLNIIDEVF